MRAIKLKKKHYWDLEQLMYDCDVVTGNTANPSAVFASPATLRIMHRTIAKMFKKDYPHITKKLLDLSVGYYMLNLSPVEFYGIKDGWVLVENG